MLEEVRAWPEDTTFDAFNTKWVNLVKEDTYRELLTGAIFVVDQLKRDGDVFKIATELRFPCFLYLAVSSSGVLH